MAGERVIYHIDCNGFYAGVECLDNPELKHVPMAVAGDPEQRSGIILAKNELAKRYGVQTAETIYQAKRKCPDLLLVPPHYQRYVEVSRKVKAIFADYTDQVESFGLDEAWLDVTGSLRYFRMSAEELAHTIRRRVKSEIGITVSVGVSFNKIFAKLGSDLKKPDAVTVISRENYRDLVWPLAAEALLFVGHNAAEHMKQFYIETIGDVAKSDPAYLEKILGKQGPALWRYANGMDQDPVRRIGEREPIKSVGNGMTFRRDLIGWEELKSGIVALSDEVASRLRAKKLKCCAVQLMIKTPALKSISRQIQLERPTHLQKDLIDAGMQILHAHWRADAPVRTLTITAIQLIGEDEAQEQTSLFDTMAGSESAKRERLERLESAMQQIRQKHGANSVGLGYVENEELGIRQF